MAIKSEQPKSLVKEVAMPYSGGTESAKKFIMKYSDIGLILDPYSEDWCLNFKKIEGMNSSSFKKYEKEFGSDFRNHMLLVMCDRDSGANDLANDLVEIYPRYKDYLINRKKNIFFEPSFLLINFATQQILGVGLGRKARLFMIDLASNKSISLNDPNDISSQALFGVNDIDYLKVFLKYDYSEFFHNFLKNVKKLGTLIYEQENDLTGYQYEELLSSEINGDGQFELNGDIYTPKERRELIKTFENYEKLIKKQQMYILQFFPMMEFGFAYNH